MAPKFKKSNSATSATHESISPSRPGVKAHETKPPSETIVTGHDSLPSKPDPNGPRVIYWHRTDLRLHDSPALITALKLHPSVFIPTWMWDPHYVYTARVGPNRWKFLVESQQCLSDSYTELNQKQKLHIVREGATTVLRKLVKKWKIDVVVWEGDTDAYGRQRDQQVMKQLDELGVQHICVMGGRTLFDIDELVKRNGGRPTMSMSQLLKAASEIDPGDGGKKGQPRKPVETPKWLPDPPSRQELDLRNDADFEHEVPESRPDFNQSHRGLGKDKDKHYVNVMGPKNDFAVVRLEEMGIDPKDACSPHKGGEKEALRLLKKYIDDEEYTATFEKPKSSPADFEPQSTTLLSPHHHFGCLSVRKFWWDVQSVFEKRRKAKKPVAGQPENFEGQLLFRDMYFGAQAALGYGFAQTQGNPIARFIPWHLQSTYSETPVGEHLLDGTYVVDNEDAEEWFRRWKEGRTGFPWIDALMRQLKLEGWIHHLGRHSVACFLTRGGCYVHWERGAEVFEEWLIDHETACNVGNWMWLSCTAFFSQFYRCYSPIAFGKKWDPEGKLIRKYVPELKHFDKKYIYEPQKAPIADQKAWRCLITGDGTDQGNEQMAKYPKQMFDFNERRQICIDEIKKAYDVKMYGDDKRVINGEWKKIFGYPSGGKVVKDETNDEPVDGETRGRKRGLGEVDDHDDGGNADVGDVSEKEEKEEEPEPEQKSRRLETKEGSKGQQKKIDGMVERRKKKS